MCLGVPGKIIAVGDEIHELATVEVSGVQRQVNIMLVCEDHPRDLLDRWVLVHVGFAMSILDEDEAHDMLSALENLTGEGDYN